MNRSSPLLLWILGLAGATASLSAQPFDVTSSGAILGSGTLRLKYLSSDSNGLNIFQAASDASKIINYYSGPLIFGTNNTERARIDNAGNVGIGTTTPSARLDIWGSWARIAHDNSNGVQLDFDASAGGGHNWSFVSWGSAAAGGSISGRFSVYDATSGGHRLLIDTSGNVGIGTVTPGYKLEVSGSVRATSFISNTTSYADFVFKPGYPLRPLTEVEAAIARDGHLPDIPSEAEVNSHGVDLASQQAKLLQKVEELTLYVIEHQKELARLREENAALRQKITHLAAP